MTAVNCPHETRTPVWVESTDDWSGADTSRWEERVTSTTRDLDTYRYQCTQCGQVFFYSGGARRLYEEGAR